MQSDYEELWDNQSFAVVGHSSKSRFPYLTYNGLKARGKAERY